LPRQHDAATLQDALRASSMGCSLLLTAVAEHWMRSGQARHLMLDIQREVRARQTLARNLLPKDVNAHPTGLHLWMTLPAHWNRQLFALALEQQGVLVACSDAFSVDANPVDAVRLSVGGARSQTDLAHALQRIATLLRRIAVAACGPLSSCHPCGAWVYGWRRRSLIGRVAGLVAHVIEEREHPIAQDIWDMATAQSHR
jgi:hypothetical protein